MSWIWNWKRPSKGGKNYDKEIAKINETLTLLTDQLNTKADRTNQNQTIIADTVAVDNSFRIARSGSLNTLEIDNSELFVGTTYDLTKDNAIVLNKHLKDIGTKEWEDLGWFNLNQQSTAIYGIDGQFSSYDNKEFLIILPLGDQGRTQFYIPRLSQSGILSTAAIFLNVGTITRFVIGTITRGVVENFDLSLLMDVNPNQSLTQVKIYWR